MIKRTGMVVVAVLLSGCLPKPQPAHLYQEPSAGENTAKLRVRGFTDSTTVYRVDSCEQAFSWAASAILTIRNGTHPGRQTGVTKRPTCRKITRPWITWRSPCRQAIIFSSVRPFSPQIIRFAP